MFPILENVNNDDGPDLSVFSAQMLSPTQNKEDLDDWVVLPSSTLTGDLLLKMLIINKFILIFHK